MNLEEHVEAIASRSGRKFAFDPTSLLMALLPILLNKCIKTEESNMARVKTYVERHTKTERKRERLEAQFAKRAMAEDEAVSEEDALALAKDTIDHVLESSNEDVTDCCRSIETT